MEDPNPRISLVTQGECVHELVDLILDLLNTTEASSTLKTSAAVAAVVALIQAQYSCDSSKAVSIAIRYFQMLRG